MVGPRWPCQCFAHYEYLSRLQRLQIDKFVDSDKDNNDPNLDDQAYGMLSEMAKDYIHADEDVTDHGVDVVKAQSATRTVCLSRIGPSTALLLITTTNADTFSNTDTFSNISQDDATTSRQERVDEETTIPLWRTLPREVYVWKIRPVLLELAVGRRPYILLVVVWLYLLGTMLQSSQLRMDIPPASASQHSVVSQRSLREATAHVRFLLDELQRI